MGPGEDVRDRDGLERAWAQVDENFDKHLGVIAAYLRQPSVSGTGEGIDACAGMTADLIEFAGGSARVVPTDGHPAVVGKVDGPGPSLLRYGMYDVQPAEETTWTSPPFAAETRNLPGVGPSIVARGAANSKGCFAAFACALASAREVADLPASVSFIGDGEEEIGSPNLPGVLAAHRDYFAADAAFDLDLAADKSGVPWVTLGCKGIVSLKLVARGGDWGGPIDRALHSSFGVAVASPAWALVKALAALVDADESPTVPGLSAATPAPEDEALIEELVSRVTASDLMGSDVRGLKGSGDPRALVNAILYEPAINLNGIEAGYVSGGKTIIPHEAHAVVDIRVPYGLDLEDIAGAARQKIAEVAPEVEVEVYELCPSTKTSATTPVARAMIDSHADAGTPALVWPLAPWWAPLYLFEEVLQVPFAAGGAGHSGRPHAADEYAVIEGLREHMRQSLAFIWRCADEMGRP